MPSVYPSLGSWVLLTWRIWALPFAFTLGASALLPRGRRLAGAGLFAGALVAVVAPLSLLGAKAYEDLALTINDLLPGVPPTLSLVGLAGVLLFLSLDPLSDRPWEGLGRRGLPLVLLLALLMPYAVPSPRPQVPEDFHFDAGYEAWRIEMMEDALEGKKRHSWYAMDSTQWFTRLARGGGDTLHSAWIPGAFHEGQAERLQLPPPGTRLGISTPLPNFIMMRDDLVHLPVSRAFLRDFMATDAGNLISGLVYIILTSSDPLASTDELAAMFEMAQEYPQWPGLAGKVAEKAALRGEREVAEALLERLQPQMERAARITGEEPEWFLNFKRALEQAHEWPLMTPPAKGSVRIVWDLSGFPEAEGDLYVGAVPLVDPMSPAWLGSEEVEGHQQFLPPVTLWPVVAGETLLAPLPAARYALEVGFREGNHPDDPWVAVSGLPEPIVVGEGSWEHTIDLKVWRENPLLPRCQEAALVWDPWPGVTGYRLLGWDLPKDGRIVPALTVDEGLSQPRWEIPPGMPPIGTLAVGVTEGEETLMPLPLTVRGIHRFSGGGTHPLSRCQTPFLKDSSSPAGEAPVP